jgi:hypothetical protein
VNARPSSRSGLAALTALLTFGLAFEVSAQSVTTTPVGAVTVTIAAGTGTSRVASILSFPLIENPAATGQVLGTITGVTSNTITNANAGWSAGALSVASTPYAVQITSGVAQGHTFLISTAAGSLNSATTLTIASEESGLVDITSLGVAVGDTYKLIPCDTLSSVLGTPETMGVAGGTSSESADIVQILVGTTYRQYYYKTGTTNAWTRVGAETVSNDIAIRPDAFVIYNRLGASAISFVLTGQVPSINRKALVRNSGLTTLSSSWPVSRTLSQLGIQNMSGWATAANSSTVATADLVQILVGTTYRQYYFNGTSWYRVGAETLSDSVVINPGAGVIISKRGFTSGATSLVQAVPYTL